MRWSSVAALLWACVCSAQSPQLLVKDAGKDNPVELTRAEIKAVISGCLSKTSITLSFHNQTDRPLEGNLVFPLPENATVSGYALDVEGSLVDAVTVEKAKATEAFESEKSRRVDPGLVEKVRGNVFRTRVYPIPRHGNRTIRLEYISELVSGDGGTMTYVLPLKWDRPVAEASIRIETIGPKDAPKTDAGGDQLTFAPWENRFIAEKHFTDVTFHESLKVVLPAFPISSVTVEKRTRSAVAVENLDPKMADHFLRHEYFFVASDRPPPPAEPPVQPSLRGHPTHLAIAWDASASRASADHARELSFLKQYLVSLKDCIVDVTVFRNVADIPRRFKVKESKAGEVIDFLESVVYDGGTSLEGLAFVPRSALDRMKPDAPAITHYLLFTDGMISQGPAKPGAVEVPVFAVGVAADSNHEYLRQLSNASGGTYLNLSQMADDEALAAIAPAPFSLLAVEYDRSEIAEVFPQMPQPVQNRVTVAGRLLAPTAKLTLAYGYGKTITQRSELIVSRDEASEEKMACGFWAQLKLADLSLMESRNAEAITRLGKEFNLVTSFTSMIVMENVDQYLRHGIVPPKSRAGIYAEFMRRIETQRGAMAKADDPLADPVMAAREQLARLENVLALWRERTDWWQEEHNYPRHFRYREPVEPRPKVARGSGGARGGGGGSGGGLFGGGGGGGGGVGFAAGGAMGGGGAISPPDFSLNSNGPKPAPPPPEDLPASEWMRPRRAAIWRPNTPVKDWAADAAYVTAIQYARKDAYGVYLELAKTMRSSPAFYLDCADLFAKARQKNLAMRILSNIPEMAMEDGRLLRIVASRLLQMGFVDQAIEMYERARATGHAGAGLNRDLAMAIADRADASAAAKDFDRARDDYHRSLELLHELAMDLSPDAQAIRVIAIEDASRIVARAMNAIRAPREAIENPFDSKLSKLMDMDVRIVLSCDVADANVELLVHEPSGEEASSAHPRTTIGGLLSASAGQTRNTQEYCLRKQMAGRYDIKARLINNNEEKLTGPVTVQVTIFTNFGRPEEHRETMIVRIKNFDGIAEVGTLQLK